MVVFLRDLMRRRGCNQSQLAKGVGVSHPTVGRWLTGEDAPNPASSARLADYSGAPLERVLALAGHFPPVTQTAPADWPEFREYVERKHPGLDEDVVAVFEAYIERKRTSSRSS
jgi:transcriptional regulator with XRE-family HTH domain